MALSQLIFIQKYSVKIATLRRLGILRLKAIYKLINICKKTHPSQWDKNQEFGRLELFGNFSFPNNNRLKMHVSQPIGEKLQGL
jgi:hypothetical protein